MHTNIGVQLNPNFMSSLLLSAVFPEIYILLIHSENNNKNPKIFAFDVFSVKCFLHPDIP